MKPKNIENRDDMIGTVWCYDDADIVRVIGLSADQWCGHPVHLAETLDGGNKGEIRTWWFGDNLFKKLENYEG